MMARGKTNDDSEAFAFLRVLAPKLELLRNRLAASNAHLNDADAATGRLNAIIETQRALKEFLSGLANFNPLLEPIDILLALLNEDAPALAAELAPAAPPVPAPLAEPDPPPIADKTAPKPIATKSVSSPDAWLRVGTRAALDKLTAAGMPAASAASYVVNAYATVGLACKDGTPVSVDLVNDWCGSKSANWRSGRSLIRKAGAPPQAKGPAAVMDAQSRVNELAVLFKKMAAAGA